METPIRHIGTSNMAAARPRSSISSGACGTRKNARMMSNRNRVRHRQVAHAFRAEVRAIAVVVHEMSSRKVTAPYVTLLF